MATSITKLFCKPHLEVIVSVPKIPTATHERLAAFVEPNASAPVHLQMGGKLMPTEKEYRQQAQKCLELAKATKALYAKQAMTELAEEFNKAADDLERKSAA